MASITTCSITRGYPIKPPGDPSVFAAPNPGHNRSLQRLLWGLDVDLRTGAGWWSWARAAFHAFFGRKNLQEVKKNMFGDVFGH